MAQNNILPENYRRIFEEITLAEKTLGADSEIISKKTEEVLDSDDTAIPQDTDISPPESSLSALEQHLLEKERKSLTNNEIPPLPGQTRGWGKVPIAEANLLNDLIKLADKLDQSDLHKEADFIDTLIHKLSQERK